MSFQALPVCCWRCPLLRFIPTTAVALMLTVLSAAVLVEAWKGLQLHRELRAITVNDRWEQQLEERGVFRGVPPILFFGDSEIAQWPMAEEFGSLPIRNRGVKGDRAGLALGRYAEALRTLHPRLVVILIGTNDLGHHRAMGDTLADIDRMVAEAPHVVLCSLLPVRGEFLADHPTAEILRWNESLKALALRRGARFVDLYRVLADERGEFRQDLTVDGLHPNAAGYAVMTQAVRPFLQ